MNQVETSTTATDGSHPGLRPDSRLTPELIRQYVESGQWEQTTLRSLLTEAVRQYPDRIAAVEHRTDVEGVRRLTYRELQEMAHRFACGLRALGVHPGDHVAAMLPNWVEFAALIFAINEVGAVYTGIPVAYGEREVEVILRRTRASVLIVASSFGSASPLQLVRKLRPQLPTLRHVVVADAPAEEDGERSLESLLDAPDVAFPDPDPSTICHVGFTSGTTGEPKGVMNTHQTLYAVLRNWVRHVDRAALGDPFVNLVGSPIGHHTGFLWGVLLTTYLGGTGVYLDRWNADRASKIIQAEGATAMFAAPTFHQDLLLTDLVNNPNCTLRIVVVTGAPVPRTLPQRAGEAFGCYVSPAWGMTELGIGISCAPHLPADAQLTDGVPVPGTELRVVDAKGNPVPAETVGDLQIRGPGLFLGYLERPDATAEAIGETGWFNTGDNALITSEGYVVLQGRTKDIVIRGGENIPVVVVESMLFEHPLVLEASVIGLPDARLGERACAVVVPSTDVEPTLEELCDYLLERGLSKHFLPERLEVIPALPKTPSGKIRKVELRGRYGE